LPDLFDYLFYPVAQVTPRLAVKRNPVHPKTFDKNA
jgi:hypothetical protein